MRLLLLMVVIVVGLWMIASVGSAEADVDRAGREMGRPLPQIQAVYAEAARRQTEAFVHAPIWTEADLPGMQ